MLTLGWSDGNTFMPVNSILLSSENDNTVVNIPESTDKRTNAYKRRKLSRSKANDAIASQIKPCQKMPLKIKFIKDDDEGILPYCEEEDAEKFYFQQILTARFSWGSNITHFIQTPVLCHLTSLQ